MRDCTFGAVKLNASGKATFPWEGRLKRLGNKAAPIGKERRT